MRRAAIAVGCVIGFFLFAPARAFQVSPVRVHLDRPWWVSGEFGDGELKLSSDQLQAIAFRPSPSALPEGATSARGPESA